MNSTRPADLTRYAYLSIATAVATIALKTGAWALTGSVGLLSDAAESLVNLAAAIVALIALKAVSRPADSRFPYGRSKAEYFSAGVEGIMIFVAAGAILVMSVVRFVKPVPLENLGIGLVVASLSGALNLVVALVLLRAGKRHGSITLTADAKHLATDVLTTIGVLVGVVLVWLTGYSQFDAVVAFLVGINIVVMGTRLVVESVQGLMDMTLPDEENAAIVAILQRHSNEQVSFHALQTRAAGRERHASVHVLVPGDWSVKRGHAFIHQVEAELVRAVPGLSVVTHLEPIEDPESYRDIPGGFIEIP